MATLPTELVGDATESTHHWELLCDLVDIDNRMAGQEGEAEGARLLAEAFEANGLRDVGINEFEIPGWWRGSSSLTVEADGREHAFDADYQTIALPGTPSGDLDVELVDVGYGRPEEFAAADCENKIVVASSSTPDDYGRWIHRGEKYGFAINHGAAGFVFRNHVEGCLPPTGSIGTPDGPGAIPAVGVSKEVGDRLVRYCEDEAIDADLTIECRNEATMSRNIEGVLGPDTDEEVLVVGSEEVGLFGAYHWVETHPDEQVKAVLNMDGAGYSRDLAVDTHRFDALGDAFEAVADEYAIPIDVSESVRPHSDHWPFVQRGIPGIQARSLSGESGRGWGHTHADTLDKLDVRDLRALTIPMTAATVKIARTDCEVSPKSVAEIREATVEDGLEAGMRNAGDWPFGDEEST